MNQNVLEIYMKKHFPGLILESPLFYQSSVGLRFELGMPYRGIEDPNYFSHVQARAVILFEEVFDDNIDILVVVKTYKSVEPYICFNQGEEVFLQYLRNKNLLDNILEVETEQHFEENGDMSGVSYKYILKCKKNDIDYKGIFAATAHADFGLEPYISDAVFFINVDNNVIYYMYDDRGLDIVSEDKRSLIEIYEKYNDWILDYDRAKIDSVFKDL